ncbi:MAG: TolC family protein [Gemmatimonadaceae bacterium]
MVAGRVHVASLLVGWSVVAGAQEPVTRQQAIDAALTRGARIGAVRADTIVARAQLMAARSFQNPVLSTIYSKAVPQYHATVDVPVDFPWVRGGRIGSAEAARDAAQYRFRFARAAIAFDADTSYTRALAAQARARLSRRTADDADSLRRIAAFRRDAGDASDLDVELATVNAGQRLNSATGDSLGVVSALLDLGALIGRDPTRVSITLADSLVLPPAGDAGLTGGVPLTVAAAQAALLSAETAIGVQRRSVFGTPSLHAGVEAGDPTGGEPGLLPTFGLSIPFPLFNRNRAPIAQAEAERERARAELDLARLESQARILRAERERISAVARAERDRRLLASADRVAAMSLTAYREGASTLPNVLEAQRSAREALSQYIDDVAAAWTASAAARLFTRTTTTP